MLRAADEGAMEATDLEGEREDEEEAEREDRSWYAMLAHVILAVKVSLPRVGNKGKESGEKSLSA
jgi:hypothetical protein